MNKNTEVGMYDGGAMSLRHLSDEELAVLDGDVCRRLVEPMSAEWRKRCEDLVRLARVRECRKVLDPLLASLYVLLVEAEGRLRNDDSMELMCFGEVSCHSFGDWIRGDREVTAALEGYMRLEKMGLASVSGNRLGTWDARLTKKRLLADDA